MCLVVFIVWVARIRCYDFIEEFEKMTSIKDQMWASWYVLSCKWCSQQLWFIFLKETLPSFWLMRPQFWNDWVALKAKTVYLS